MVEVLWSEMLLTQTTIKDWQMDLSPHHRSDMTRKSPRFGRDTIEACLAQAGQNAGLDTSNKPQAEQAPYSDSSRKSFGRADGHFRRYGEHDPTRQFAPADSLNNHLTYVAPDAPHSGQSTRQLKDIIDPLGICMFLPSHN